MVMTGLFLEKLEWRQKISIILNAAQFFVHTTKALSKYGAFCLGRIEPLFTKYTRAKKDWHPYLINTIEMRSP